MRIFTILITLSLLLPPAVAVAATPSDREIGIRGGLDGSNSSLAEEYSAAEIYYLHPLPWQAALGKQVTLATRFDVGATFLNSDNEENGMLAIGADLVLGLWQNRLEFEVGCRPTWMFDDEYGADDFGGNLQFTSHAGLAVNWRSLVITFRAQHTSNAGFYRPNPGINLQMLGLGYRF